MTLSRRRGPWHGWTGRTCDTDHAFPVKRSATAGAKMMFELAISLSFFFLSHRELLPANRCWGEGGVAAGCHSQAPWSKLVPEGKVRSGQGEQVGPSRSRRSVPELFTTRTIRYLTWRYLAREGMASNDRRQILMRRSSGFVRRCSSSTVRVPT